MKRFCVLLSILAILNMGVSIADAQRWIPGTNLRAAVRDALDLADGDRLTKAAIRDMTELSASSSEISDLTGLEFATNLIDLKLNGNSISDLSPLSGLENLTGLHIWSNDITDLSPLADMTQLEVLRCTNNSVSDLSALAGLVNLKRLSIKGNNVSDVSPLSGLESLDILHLARNPITNTSVLAGLVSNLTQPLDIVMFPDRNLEVLVRESLRNSEGLADDEMLTPEFMALLTRVEAHTGTPVIRSLGGLEHATNLEELIFGNTENARRDLTPLAGLAHLKRVELEGQSSALETLLTLPSLRTLRLRYAGLTDLTTVSELTGVRTLQLNFNGNLRDLTPLADMENLRSLTVAGNYSSSSDPWNLTAADALSDISPLSALENLTYLSLAYNGISDLSSLSALENLEELYLHHNNISDVSPLVGLTGLTKLQLLGNPVANASALYPLTQQDTPVDIDIDVPEPVVEVEVEIALAFSGMKTGPFDITITFSDAVTGFHQSDVSFESPAVTAEITAWDTQDNITYTATVTPTISETVLSESLSIRIPAGVAIDAENNLNIAAVSTQVRIVGGDIVEFTDVNLAAAIRDTLSVAANQNITTTLLGFVSQLTANNLQISDLTGLEHATSLRQLSLNDNSISDVLPLGSLTSLTSLRLDDNDIVNISSLGSLTRLLVASFAGNEIVDIPSLEEWSRISVLDLRDNNITDVSPLEDVTSLTSLTLTGNPILDTRPLYPLTQQSPAVTIDIAVSQYAPWDVNEDGNVDATDTALVTAAIGQSGASIVDSRTDVDGDDDVDNDDLLLVTGNLDGANGAAPTTLGGIVNLVDTATLESLDRDALQAQLQILRTESDGSVKYRNAIALLEAFLVATRPEETMLLANYPNPFNPETWIPYHLADASNVRITIYDTRGVVVRRLDLGHQREGYYTSRSRAAYWDGRNAVGERVASGIYFYELAADDISLLRKMVILK